MIYCIEIIKFQNKNMLIKIYFVLFCEFLLAVSYKIEGDLDWWQKTIIYQVYPRSFKDSNGDGIGDLKGIEQKADYFKQLGVGAIWLNPIFESPMVDFGYDISNYTRIYEKFGTVDDLKSLAKKLKEIGVKLILDFVPNHTSDESEWFQKSVERIDPYTDYYVWKDPKGWNNESKPMPPNNWISAFNIEPAWTYNVKRNQFYLHHFHEKMPDLNYRNKLVQLEMENIIKFWLDAGVDGFRIDAVPYLVEDINFPDEDYIDPNQPKNEYYNMIHSYTKDQPETYEILRKWRLLFDNYTTTHGNETRLFMTEAYTDLNKTMLYYGTEKEPISHIPFNFELIVKLSPQSKSTDYIKVIKDWIDLMPTGKWANWVVGNHDRKRVATLFGVEMVDVLNILVTMLPGTAINYYGDELGMQNTFIRWDQTVDPQGLVLGQDKYESGSRDGSRTPMQWDNTTNAGFSNASKTWLPVNPDYWRVNLMAQEQSANSHYNLYRKLAAARQLPTIQRGDFEIYAPDNWTLVFIRSLQDHPTFIIILNIGSDLIQPDLTTMGAKLPKEDVYVYTASSNSILQTGDKLSLTPPSFKMRPKSGLVLTTDLDAVSASSNPLLDEWK